MIPPYIHRDVKSVAEKKVFDLIKHEEHLERWICFHSLGISEHEKKVEGEIDFLLIGPDGLYCLEVKGGRVTREDGIWKFIDRYGRINTKPEGPFEQADSAMYSLKNNIRSKYPTIANECIFGYGVIFPDFQFNISSPEWNEKIVYDVNDRRKSFSHYIKRLIGYWRAKLPNKRELLPDEIAAIIKYIRGDFELVQPIGSRIAELDTQMVKLTENQYKALDRMENNRRVFFRGTAGTGKTLIAMEKARRLSYDGYKVLVICYNKILGGKLNTNSKVFHNSGNITADSIHKHFYKTITSTSLKNEFISALESYTGEELYKRIYPDYFVRALNEKNELYDYLIIDEGQDLLCYEYISALDYVLKGGLEKGRWAIFYDSNNQGNLYQNFDSNLVNDLINMGATEYWLDVNCRNTQQIATQTSVISGFKVEDTLIREGEKVRFVWYENKEEIPQMLKKSIKDLITNKVLPGEITILFPENQFQETIAFTTTGLPCGVIKIDYDNAGSLSPDKISYSSVQAYKGLENKVVIYLGVEEMDGEWVNTVNYVAMTRARQLLYIFARKSLRDIYGEKSISFLKAGRQNEN